MARYTAERTLLRPGGRDRLGRFLAEPYHLADWWPGPRWRAGPDRRRPRSPAHAGDPDVRAATSRWRPLLGPGMLKRPQLRGERCSSSTFIRGRRLSFQLRERRPSRPRSSSHRRREPHHRLARRRGNLGESPALVRESRALRRLYGPRPRRATSLWTASTADRQSLLPSNPVSGHGPPKYVFVTGGVVSALGKGIVAASLGRLPQGPGIEASSSRSFDPYLNVRSRGR